MSRRSLRRLRTALRQAAALARWHGAQLTVLYVWPTLPAGVVAAHGPIPPLSLDESVRDDLRSELNRAVGQAGVAGVSLRTRVAEGDPATEIVRAASETEADLVVMGTHGRKGLDRLLVGSVTEGVLGLAPCPVLSAAPSAQSPMRPARMRTILCPVDFSDASLRAVEYGFALAQEQRARLALLHVVESMVASGEQALFLSPDFGARLCEDALARLQALIPESAEDWCIAEAQVRLGQVLGEILRAARDERADVIVIGAPSRRALALGSRKTLRAVAHEAGCPVLAVPARGRLARARPRTTSGGRQEERSVA